MTETCSVYDYDIGKGMNVPVEIEMGTNNIIIMKLNLAPNYSLTAGFCHFSVQMYLCNILVLLLWDLKLYLVFQ